MDQFAQLHPVVQALCGSLFTWGVTALGASLVFFAKNPSQECLNGLLGFASGVMLAAIWGSLLMPAVELADSYESFAFVPAMVGFLSGGAFLSLVERFLPDLEDQALSFLGQVEGRVELTDPEQGEVLDEKTQELKPLKPQSSDEVPHKLPHAHDSDASLVDVHTSHQRNVRVILLLISITLHNFPEGMAVGVAFGAAKDGMNGEGCSSGVASALALAFGIGLQNFPEGLAVSAPLRTIGFSRSRSFFWGQLSGAVEPIGAMLGAALVTFVAPILPYFLGFAAGAMMKVVLGLVLESQQDGTQTIGIWSTLIGFVVMFSLDVGLGGTAEC